MTWFEFSLPTTEGILGVLLDIVPYICILAAIVLVILLVYCASQVKAVKDRQSDTLLQDMYKKATQPKQKRRKRPLSGFNVFGGE